MNKIISVSLNGIIIKIDEEAYQALKNYLDSIQDYFKNATDGREITLDIETRIGELLLLKLTENHTAIMLQDVTDVIAIMGKPADYGVTEEKTDSHTNNKSVPTSQNEQISLKRDPVNKIIGGVCAGVGNYLNIDPLIVRAAFLISFFVFGSGILLYLILWAIMPLASVNELPDFKGRTRKRFYRNPDNKKIGGVCSGIATYIAVDTVWVRLAFAVSFFVFGSGFLLYIVLWILIPEAKSAADKLQMKGNNIDIETITNQIRNTVNQSTQNNPGIESGLKTLIKIGAMVTGVVILLFFVMPSIAVLCLIYFGVLTETEWQNFFQSLLITTTIFNLVKWSVVLTTLSVISAMATFALRLLVRFKLAWISGISTFLFLTGIIIGGIGFAKYMNQIKSTGSYTKSYQPIAIADTFDIERINMADEMTFPDHPFKVYVKIDEEYFHYQHALLEVIPTTEKMGWVKINQSSKGANQSDADSLAKQISINENFTSNKLQLSLTPFQFNPHTPFKFQKTKVMLFLPINTVVRVTDFELAELIESESDGDFNTNLDEDTFTAVYYVVTENGLLNKSNDTDLSIKIEEEIVTEESTKAHGTHQKVTKRKKVGPITIETHKEIKHEQN